MERRTACEQLSDQAFPGCFGARKMFAIFRRFWAIAARRNSSFAPHGPRNRSLPSPRMRLRWAKSISTSFRSFIEMSYWLVLAMSRAIDGFPGRIVCDECGPRDGRLHLWFSNASCAAGGLSVSHLIPLDKEQLGTIRKFSPRLSPKSACCRSAIAIAEASILFEQAVPHLFGRPNVLIPRQPLEFGRAIPTIVPIRGPTPS